MSGKTQELEALAASYMADPTLKSNPFTMALNGVVDAAVNGGVTMYRTTFFAPSYLEKNPDHRAWVDQLRTAILQQACAHRDTEKEWVWVYHSVSVCVSVWGGIEAATLLGVLIGWVGVDVS
jgi:hypothetical protein